MYTQKDGNLEVFNGKKVAIIGYGSQGHAHALNLKESGVDVMVGLRENSNSREKAKSMGLEVKTVSECAKEADLIMILLPDEKHKSVFNAEILPHLRKGQTISVAHGFSVMYKQVVPPEFVDVIMIAPKGPGHLVRRVYEKGQGVPCLVAVYQDVSGRAKETALAYAKALGGLRAGAIETTFKEETQTDLFGEQAVLCGGVTGLIKAGFDTLVDAGYQPEIAYFECLHEMKLIVDLIYEGGFEKMRHSISDTAEFGDYVTSDRIVNEDVKKEMKKILHEIQNGDFAERWILENEKGRPYYNTRKQEELNHRIVETGKNIRAMMNYAE